MNPRSGIWVCNCSILVWLLKWRRLSMLALSETSEPLPSCWLAKKFPKTTLFQVNRINVSLRFIIRIAIGSHDLLFQNFSRPTISQRPYRSCPSPRSRDGWLMSDAAPTICLHASYRPPRTHETVRELPRPQGSDGGVGRREAGGNSP